MPRRLRCSLLCEDLEQEKFFRPILERMFGRVHVERRAVQEAGGIIFVLNQLQHCVDRIRCRPNEAVGLVVVVDGDEDGVNRRMTQLDSKLDIKREPHERIAYCVPTRTVETWEYWLNGATEIDEITPYKHKVEQQGIKAKAAANAWFDQQPEARRKLESVQVPSLVTGRRELATLASKAHRS